MKKNSKERRNSKSRTSLNRPISEVTRCYTLSREASTKKMMHSWTNMSTCSLSLRKFGKNLLLEVDTSNARIKMRPNPLSLKLEVLLKPFNNRRLHKSHRLYLNLEAVRAIEELKIILINNLLPQARNQVTFPKNNSMPK